MPVFPSLAPPSLVTQSALISTVIDKMAPLPDQLPLVAAFIVPLWLKLMLLEAQWCAISAGDWFCQKPLTSQSARVAIEPTGLTPPALTMVPPPLVAASGNGSPSSLSTAVLPAGAAPGLVSAGQYVV